MKKYSILPDDFRIRIAATKTPRELAELIFRQLATQAEIREINFVCDEHDDKPGISCFVETGTSQESVSIARLVGGAEFGGNGTFFELEQPKDFHCHPYNHPGDDTLPARVSFVCLMR
jgi:hypothetical protein